MKFYLSGASAEVETCAAWIKRLEAEGHECTHNWCIERMDKPGPDSQHGDEERERLANVEVSGILRADVFWLLLPDAANTTRGAWFEFGVADACLERVYVSGDVSQSIFTGRAAACFHTHEEAFAFITRQP